MKIPQLRKKLEVKSCHNTSWEDNYSWVHQKNILEVLKDGSKLLPEVRDYLNEENKYTDFQLKDTSEIQKTLFKEIKGRIKLEDESLKYKDKAYEYWTKTTEKGNYSIKLRKKIGTENIEEIWNGDLEKKKLNTNYFGVGDLEVSYNDKYLAYSLDVKGSEYFTIYVRDIKTNTFVTEEIKDTSGSIMFSLDDKFIFYSKLDENHRPRKIFRHEIGKSVQDDILIFEEKKCALKIYLKVHFLRDLFFSELDDEEVDFFRFELPLELLDSDGCTRRGSDTGKGHSVEHSGHFGTVCLLKSKFAQLRWNLALQSSLGQLSPRTQQSEHWEHLVSPSKVDIFV